MKPRSWTEAELQRAMELYVAGSSYADIGRALGRSETVVRVKFVNLVSMQPLPQKEAVR